MEIHLGWIHRVAAAVVVVFGLGGAEAVGQYGPYQAATQNNSVAPYGVQPQQSVYPTTQAPGYRAQQGRYATRPQYQPPRYQVPRYQVPTARPGYPTAAQRPAAQRQPYGRPPVNVAMSQQSETLPTPASAPATGGTVMPGSSTYDGSYDAGSGASYGANYPGSYAGAHPMYQQPQAGCSTCNSSYPATGGYDEYGVASYFEPSCGGTQWFGGVYGLYMTRENPDFRRLTIEVPTGSVAYPYYPTPDVTALEIGDADHDYREGYEVRFGSTISVGGGCETGCDPYGHGYGSSCGGCNCSKQDYAWEIGYWLMDDDLNSSQAIETDVTDGTRLYGQVNYGGLEYDADGAGGTFSYRLVNEYYAYQVPVTTPGAPGAGDLRVLAQRVRSNFRAQNLELNLLRLPMIGGSCNSGSCSGYGEYAGYGSCDSCGPVACGSPFTVTALAGVRYIRLDDDFGFDTMVARHDGASWDIPAFTGWTGGDNEIFHDINVDNHLTGFQLGANMNYDVTCNCSLFCDSSFGLYNNHMRSSQRFSGTGQFRYVNGAAAANVSSRKDDIAFVGEMRCGGTYKLDYHWRALFAYRAVAMSGVALSVDQIPSDFSNPEQVGLIDSDGSIVIHGIQAGVECRY